MNIDIKNLPESSDLLRKMIIDMSSELAELNLYKSKYERLVEELSLAKQQRFAPSSEKNVLQPDFFDEAGTLLSDGTKDDNEKRIEITSHTRSKHPIRRPLPGYLEREDIVHDISDEEKVCHCGTHLARIGEEASEQLKYVPSKLSVIRHVRPKYACKQCQENVKIAKMPRLLLPKCIATPELVAYTIVAKYCDHIPLYRQSSIWRRMEIDIPRSSLCGWLLKVSVLCGPLIRELQKIIVSYDYVQADETTVQVLNEEGRENTTKSYMWCYRGGGKDLSIVYEYQETRGGYHAREFLSGFKGYLQSDAFSGYNWAHDVQDITSIGCNAHARRPFAELAKLTDTSGLATTAIKFYRQLYAIEKEARDKNYTAEKRYSLRKERSEPILKEFKEWLDRYHLKTSEQGKIGKAIRYCLSHWAKLTGYLKDGRIEIDNNLLENAIRPFALGRKNWLFVGSPAGAKAGAIFYSLIETCKANNVEPYRYFCAMLDRIRECENEENYRELLPQYIDL
ncbi:MAG: IS66 family transposase [Pseudomonadota bacterium]|nr:IS66 family transposase [Pseudomonadota bacterium]